MINSDEKFAARVRFGEVEFEVAGDKEFVEKHISEWREKLSNGSELGSKPPTPAVDKTQKAAAVNINDLPELFSYKKPQTQNEAIAVFGYYFENKEGKKEFDTKDLLGAFDQVRVKRPKNIHDSVKKCYDRTGYILPVSGKKSWRLSTEGVRKVELMPEGESGGKK